MRTPTACHGIGLAALVGLFASPADAGWFNWNKPRDVIIETRYVEDNSQASPVPIAANDLYFPQAANDTANSTSSLRKWPFIFCLYLSVFTNQSLVRVRL